MSPSFSIPFPNYRIGGGLKFDNLSKSIHTQRHEEWITLVSSSIPDTVPWRRLLSFWIIVQCIYPILVVEAVSRMWWQVWTFAQNLAGRRLSLACCQSHSSMVCWALEPLISPLFSFGRYQETRVYPWTVPRLLERLQCTTYVNWSMTRDRRASAIVSECLTW